MDATDDMYQSSSYNGGTNKAAITFQLVNCLNTTKRMHSSSYSSDLTWKGTEMRQTTLPEILSGMDSTLSGSIRTVTKYAATSSSSSIVIDTADQLFLLAEIEVFGTTINSYAGEGRPYEFWNDNNTNTARRKSVNGSYNYWWFRSPKMNGTGTFCCVNRTGEYNSSSVSIKNGISFAFCI